MQRHTPAGSDGNKSSCEGGSQGKYGINPALTDAHTCMQTDLSGCQWRLSAGHVVRRLLHRADRWMVSRTRRKALCMCHMCPRQR